MSGICAVLGPDAERLVKKVCGSLRHRGPDGEDFFIDRNVALGHRALQTDNIPAPNQPLANEDRTIWITFDGRIYNKGQLIEQLEKNYTFETNCSAEVVVHAYEENGPNCVNLFNGMFAFCLWDSAKGKFFCARDRVGIKPLYYCNCPDMFLLASEIKALLTAPSVPRKPNEHIIYDYLVTGHHHHTEDTFFIGIKKLLPAHYMFVDQNRIRIRRYWNPVKTLRTDRSIKEDQDYASEFRKLLRDSVTIRLPADLTFGTFLSGGLDSTSIACLVNDILSLSLSATTISGQRQELFSAIYREPVAEGDERPYIEEVVRALATNTNYVFPSIVRRWNDIRKFTYSMDEPVSVFNYYIFWCLSRKAREKVTVTLYGITGGLLAADTVSHYKRYFKELWRRKKIARLLIELVGVLPRARISSIAKMHAMLTRSGESEIKGLLAPQFVAHFFDEAQIEDISLSGEYRRFRDSLLDHLRVCDRVSSAFSIEPRYPFLDHRIVEFTFSLPITQKIRNGWTKYVLRNAMKGLIPEVIRKTRKKFGAPIPLERWMIELRGNIRKIFESTKFRERGYFNQPAILDVYDRFCEGKLDRFTSARYAEIFWRILNLELWLETFFDSASEINPAEFCNKSMEDRSK